jgi:hypothetical protein
MMDDTKNEPLDHALDTALVKYAAAEPRAGLEDRILANLRAQERQSAGPIWWRWIAIGAVAMLVAVFALTFSSKRRELVSTPNPVKHGSGKQTQALGTTTESQSTKQRASISAVMKNRPHHATIIAVTAPRLQQFPSPQPLSEQEKILAAYVAKYPQHAALIAEARAEELRRDEEEMAETTSGNQDSVERNK